MTLLAELNWLAVVTGALVAYVVGAIWYSPKVFGKVWMEAQPGRDFSEFSKLPLIIEAAACFMLAVFLCWLISISGLESVLLLFIAWALCYLSGSLFLGQAPALWLVGLGYNAARFVSIISANFLL